MQELQKALGRQIREAREAAGMTQKDLGGELDYTAMAISHFENGIRDMKLSDIHKLSSVLNRDLSFFLSTGHTFFRADNQSPNKAEMEKSISDFDKFLQQNS